MKHRWSDTGWSAGRREASQSAGAVGPPRPGSSRCPHRSPDPWQGEGGGPGGRQQPRSDASQAGPKRSLPRAGRLLPGAEPPGRRRKWLGVLTRSGGVHTRRRASRLAGGAHSRRGASSLAGGGASSPGEGRLHKISNYFKMNICIFISFELNRDYYTQVNTISLNLYRELTQALSCLSVGWIK